MVLSFSKWKQTAKYRENDGWVCTVLSVANKVMRAAWVAGQVKRKFIAITRGCIHRITGLYLYWWNERNDDDSTSSIIFAWNSKPTAGIPVFFFSTLHTLVGRFIPYIQLWLIRISSFSLDYWSRGTVLSQSFDTSGVSRIPQSPRGCFFLIKHFLSFSPAVF